MTQKAINIRISDAAYQKLQAAAEERGVTVTAYLRILAEEQQVCPRCQGAGRVPA